MIHNLNINDFLKTYWQKKPLLIRNAFPNFQSPVSAEELAGLSCENFVESRLISEHEDVPRWRLENGPFKESRFSELPDSHWTLLIQGINTLLPEFDDILHEFNFIPSWRVDDVMASYAVTDGSVGPHIDQYDVFLLQASGRRKWMISEQEINDDNLESGLPLKIINNFKTEFEWILNPGDILYLPPNIPHYGIAVENCITLSIGFRAPSHAEILSSFVDEYLPSLNDALRYQDADLEFNENCGEISNQALNKICKLIQSHFSDEDMIKEWFGRFITDYHNDEVEIDEHDLTSEEFLTKLKNSELRRTATVRANYILSTSGSINLFINGQTHRLSSNLTNIAKLFCNQHIFSYENLRAFFNNLEVLHFLTDLYNSGYLEFMDGDYYGG